MTLLPGLYQEVILDHNKKPRNYGLLKEANCHAEGVNPLCGDHITLNLNLRDDKIEGIGFEGEACAICKASASMMTTIVKEKTVQEVEQTMQIFRDLVMGKVDPASVSGGVVSRLAVFAGVAQLPTRVKCAVLPWHTLHSALHDTHTATTEGESDPAGSG